MKNKCKKLLRNKELRRLKANLNSSNRLKQKVGYRRFNDCKLWNNRG